MKDSNVSTDLYRHFANDGKLLYVGISLSTIARLSQHREASGWYCEISSISIEKFKSREEAIEAEKIAIKAERPKYNIVHKEDIVSANKEAKSKIIFDSKNELLKRIVSYKVTYTQNELADVLNIPKSIIKELLEDGTIHNIVVSKKIHPSSAKPILKRIVTGWQLIEFIEFMDRGGIDDRLT